MESKTDEIFDLWAERRTELLDNIAGKIIEYFSHGDTKRKYVDDIFVIPEGMIGKESDEKYITERYFEHRKLALKEFKKTGNVNIFDDDTIENYYADCLDTDENIELVLYAISEECERFCAVA